MLLSLQLFLDDRGNTGHQRIGRHILYDHAPRCGDRAAPNTDRRNQHRIAPDLYVILDDGFVLANAVIVAGHCARAYVDVFAESRIAQIGQVRSFCASPDLGLLDFNEIANAGFFSDLSPGAQAGEWTDGCPVANCAIFYDTRVANRNVVADLDVLQTRPRMYSASRADSARTFDNDLWMDHRVLANLDVLMNIGRPRIDDRHSRKLQLTEFPFAKFAVQIGKLDPRINPEHLFGARVAQQPNLPSLLLHY